MTLLRAVCRQTLLAAAALALTPSSNQRPSMNLTGMIKQGVGSAALILFAGCTVPGSPDTFSTATVRETKPSPSPATRPFAPAKPFLPPTIDPPVPAGTLEKNLAAVDLTNGIGPAEAAFLAHAYFMRYEGLCGSICGQRRDSTAWRISTVVGPTGVSGQDIFIDVYTGAVSQRYHPAIRPPWKELRSIQEVYDERALDAEHIP